VLDHLDERIEHRDTRMTAVRRGKESIRSHFDELWSESPDASFEVDEIVAEGDWVVVRQTWSGLASGGLVTWVARRFADGRVQRIDVCETREQALAVAEIRR
jgi:predicted SnoaL-like aldol condensation-catalyzing enzyme